MAVCFCLWGNIAIPVSRLKNASWCDLPWPRGDLKVDLGQQQEGWFNAGSAHQKVGPTVRETTYLNTSSRFEFCKHNCASVHYIVLF